MRLTTEWLASAGAPPRPETIVVIDRDGGRSPLARSLATVVRRHPALAALVRRARRAWVGLGPVA
jgi:hypothetical protein